MEISFRKYVLYYLVTLLAKHTSFCFEDMSKLFLKSCTIPTTIEKIVLQIYHQSNKKAIKYIFLQVFIAIGNTKSTHQ